MGADYLVLPAWRREADGAEFAALDERLHGVLTRLTERGDVTGKAGETVVLPDLPGAAADRAVVVGLGEPTSLTAADWARAVRAAARKATDKPGRSLAVVVAKEVGEAVGLRRAVAEAACAAVVAGAGPDLYKQERDRFPLDSLTAVLPDAADVQPAGEALERGRSSAPR